MALSGLDIYKLLPKTNCKDCGFATCLAFAMALAQKKVSLDKCPHITANAREALESAAQPPIKLVTIGTGSHKIEIGNETVMYRHEQKFYHPSAIGFLVEDAFSDADIGKAISDIKKLEFERVGQVISANLICIRNSSKNKEKFISAVKKVAASTDLCIALDSSDPAAMAEAAKAVKGRRPLIISPDAKSAPEFAKIAKENNAPLAVTCTSLDEVAQMTDAVKKAGIEEVVINLNEKSPSRKIQGFTYARRAALKKNFRALGYPVLAFTQQADPSLELAEAISYILKYAGIVIMKGRLSRARCRLTSSAAIRRGCRS